MRANATSAQIGERWRQLHLPPMLTTGSITTETFSAALLGLEDLSLRLTAAALHVAANPEKHPRLRLMLADLSEVM